jgi:hypothetical protein
MVQAAQKEEQANYIKGGAEFLALQSTEETDDEPQKELMPLESWQTLRGYLEQETQALRTWRNSWWMENWSDLATFICPRRSIWMTQSSGGWPTANNMLRGQEINQAIVDPTATYAVRICAGGMVSGLASPSRPWFKMVCANKNQSLDAASRQWMDETEDKIYTVLAQSNFYNAFAQECEDEIVYGTSPCICYDDASDIVRFYNPAVGEYYLACNGTMRVDTLYRVFVMTIRQIVSFFGEENLPPDIRSMWEQGGSQLEVEKIIAHAIEPNFAIRGDRKTQVKGNFTYREVYWVYGTGSEQPLSFVGFVECPFTVGRWATQSNDAYGRSVGMDVLPDVIQLQMETRRKAEAMEKNIRPPLIADMSMKNQPSSQQPDSITYVPMINGGVGMRSMYDQKLNLADITADISQIQQRIRVGFFNDLFLMISEVQTGRMTAVEVNAKVAEKMLVLGPVVESKLEQLKLKLKRVYAIMERRGLISPKPPGLKGVPLTVEFTSMMAIAQRAAATGGIERILAMVGNMVSVFPQAADNVDPDYLINLMNSLLGNPEAILRGPEQLAQIRQQRAQQQQQAQQAAMQEHAANTMNTNAQSAQVLSQTQIGGGQSALQAAIGQ